MEGSRTVGDSSRKGHVVVNGTIRSSPKANDSEAEDAKNGDHVVRIRNHVLPRKKFITYTSESPKSGSPTPTKQCIIDTASPFESVKEAGSKFGGMVRWKSNRTQTTLERRNVVGQDLEKLHEDIVVYRKWYADAEEAKVQVLKELENTNRQIKELKLSLERAQTEEYQAKQDFELATLRAEEMGQGNDDGASIAANVQVEIAKARHETVHEELEALRKEYAIVVTERDIAVKKAEEAVSESKEVENRLEELTIELMATKDSLESAQAARSVAEEKRLAAAMARDQDTCYWEKELKQSEEELQRLIQQINSAKDLQPKIDNASALLLDLKAELAASVESRHELESLGQTPEKGIHTDIPAVVASAKKELEEVKLKIEKATAEVDSLKAVAVSLKSDLEKEKSALKAIKSVASGKDEKVARDNMVEAPRQLQQPAQEADEAKSLAQMTNKELKKVKEEAEQAKTTMESKLLAVQKEIEAAKVSEKLALAAMKAFQDSESAQRTDNVDSQDRVMLSLEEYYNLIKHAYEAEQQANMRAAAAISRVEVTKQSQSSSSEKLEEVNREMAERRELLIIALEKADKAKEGKLDVEQELRQWRADKEQLRKAAELSCEGNHHPRASLEGKKLTMYVEYVPTSPSSTLDGPMELYGNDTESESSPETTFVKKKKKTLIPKIVSFFSRTKSSLLKSKSKTKSKSKSKAKYVLN